MKPEGVWRSLFDEAWYRSAGSSFDGDAYEHFRAHGHRENRSPHPIFDVQFYRSQADDLDPNDDPLEHFIRSGASRGLSPHPLFDTAYYMRRNGEAVGDENPLSHYLAAGTRSQPCAFFDGSYYAEAYPELGDSGLNPLVHYVTLGFREGRPHRDFDGAAYARRRTLPANANPLIEFVRRLRGHGSWNGPASNAPDVSIVVLNYRRALLTLQCVADVLDSTRDTDLEIVVVDNNSDPEDFALLSTALPRAVRVVRLSVNRFFGEGCNIGVESSRGSRVLFLNNDAFLHRDALGAMLDVLENGADAGAVGPKFVFPDGTLQECGAMVSSCGTVTQRGKYLDDRAGRFTRVEAVDYVSAACLLVSRELFDQVGGFDLAWDPAYYEDVDLCLKLAMLGKKTYYCPSAVVTHLEHATTSGEHRELQLEHVIAINRERFVNRWADWIERGRPPELRVAFPPAIPAAVVQPAASAVLFTPYALVPGGGERYLLTCAQMLSRSYRTTIVTPERYSVYRLRALAAALAIDIGPVSLEPLSALPRLADCDVFIALGNETQPPIAAFGKRSIFACQFPFPMDVEKMAAWWGRLEGYDDVVVYSHFAARHFRESAERIAARLPRLTVMPPPSLLYEAPDARRLPGRILNVGRFTERGHCKRQDVLVDAFRSLVEAGDVEGLELHLAGSVAPDGDARNFCQAVHERARGLPVVLHPNATADEIKDLYTSSSCYWHATGYGVSEQFFPERFEHFGISVIEAMSAGTVPLVFAAGGPADNVTDAETGFHWSAIPELVSKTLSFLKLDDDEANVMRERAIKEARRFGAAAFEARLSAFLGPAPNNAPEAVASAPSSNGAARPGRARTIRNSHVPEPIGALAAEKLARTILGTGAADDATVTDLVAQAEARLWLLMDSHRALRSSVDSFEAARHNGAVALDPVEAQKLRLAESRLDAVVQESTTLSERCAQLEAEVRSLEEAARRAADEISEQRDLTSALQVEFASAQLSERAALVRLTDLQTDLDRVTTSHRNARTEAAESTLALEQARVSLAATAAHLDAIVESRSWRLTKPLRVAVQALWGSTPRSQG